MAYGVGGDLGGALLLYDVTNSISSDPSATRISAFGIFASGFDMARASRRRLGCARFPSPVSVEDLSIVHPCGPSGRGRDERSPIYNQ